MMRSKKIRFFALALVAMMALSIVAVGAYVYEVRYGHNTLKQGHTGTFVRNLQTDINFTGGGNCGTPDGVFGPNTKEGVKQYQGNRGLSVDGEAGYSTKTKLWYEIGF